MPPTVQLTTSHLSCCIESFVFNSIEKFIDTTRLRRQIPFSHPHVTLVSPFPAMNTQKPHNRWNRCAFPANQLCLVQDRDAGLHDKRSVVLSIMQVPPNGFPRLLRILPIPWCQNGSKQRACIHLTKICRLFFVSLVDASCFLFFHKKRCNPQDPHHGCRTCCKVHPPQQH
jgi:hypothetical protein